MTRRQALSEWRDKKAGFKRMPTERDNYFLYELRKKRLPPDLSPEQYEAACMEIARELGI